MPVQAHVLTKIIENAHKQCRVPVTKPEQFSHLYRCENYKGLVKHISWLDCDTRLRVTIDHLVEQYRLSLNAFTTTRTNQLQKLLKDKEFTASVVSHETAPDVYPDLFADIPAIKHTIVTKTGKYVFVLPVDMPEKPKTEKPRTINVVGTVNGETGRHSIQATRVELAADTNRVFYMHKALDGNGYTISDYLTGFPVGGGKNKAAAIEKANSNIARYKPAEMAEIYKNVEEKHGKANQ